LKFSRRYISGELPRRAGGGFTESSILLALLGAAVIAAVPASAMTANFSFTGCGGSGDTQCSSTLSSYGPVASTGTLSVNATVTSLVIGSGSGTTISTTQDFRAAELGSYSGDGLGVCETKSQNNSGNDCDVPNHQVGNGPNTTVSGSSSPNNSSSSIGTNDFEFVLIQFSTAVDLSQITLGNYGTNGSTNPFNTTYFTSASTDSLSQMETALEATTVGALTNTGFAGTEAQESCTTGATTSTATSNSACGVDNTGINENLSGNSVTYLLIAASITDTPGNDYFKIQDLKVTNDPPPAPEPATFGIFGFALAGLGWYARKRKLS
jgi:hypothetical protein